MESSPSVCRRLPFDQTPFLTNNRNPAQRLCNPHHTYFFLLLSVRACRYNLCFEEVSFSSVSFQLPALLPFFLLYDQSSTVFSHHFKFFFKKITLSPFISLCSGNISLSQLKVTLTEFEEFLHSSALHTLLSECYCSETNL